MIHELKIFTEFFAAVACGVKRAELRKNDRNYQVGDTLHLCEFNQVTGLRTGEYINVTVTHIADVGAWLPGYVLLSVELVDKPAQKVPVVPNGWQLVPKVPTQEMCNAVLGRACFSRDGDGARYIFNAMLKHAPALPAAEPATDNTAQQFEALATSQPQKPPHWSTLVTQPFPAAPGSRQQIGGCDWLDWNQLSALGLLERINREMLHPIGLAAMRETSEGSSPGALISPDGEWHYPDSDTSAGSGKQ